MRDEVEGRILGVEMDSPSTARILAQQVRFHLQLDECPVEILHGD
jgi:hypothetical protein